MVIERPLYCCAALTAVSAADAAHAGRPIAAVRLAATPIFPKSRLLIMFSSPSSNGRAIQMSLARCGEEFSIAKLAAVFLQFALETRLSEHRAIDYTAWDLPVLNVEHSPDVGCTISSEALIGPAKCVRRHDDMVEREERIGRVGRFLLKHVKGCASDPPACQNVRERLLIDDWSARSIDDKGGLLHQSEAISIHEVAGLGRQRTVHGNDVGADEDVVETNEFDSERGSLVGIRKWIMGDESHVERLGEAEKLSADIADTDRTQHSADEANAHMFAANRKTRWTLPGELVLHHQPSGERQNEGHNRHGDGAAHAVGCGRQRDVCGGTRGHIHRVITDAKAGDDTQPTVLGCAFGRKPVS